MANLPAHVVRFDAWVDPAFDARLSREPGLALAVHPMPATPGAARAALAGAHVYHVSAARDELPAHCRVGPELLAQCPSLLCASSYGAGYDPIFHVREAGSTYGAMAYHLKSKLGSRGKAAREIAPALRRALSI